MVMDTMDRQDEVGSELRELAIARLRKKSEFKMHLLTYALINTFVIAIWAVTGSGFFWPVFPILGWGIGLIFHAWDAYGRTSPTEAQIHREMESMRRDLG
jgi:uncharacterized membrane protein